MLQPSDSKNSIWIYCLPLIAVLIWAVNIVVTRYAVDFISPISISFYRWFIAWCILTPFLALNVWRHREEIKPHLTKLAVLGLFGMVCYQGFAYSAAHYTTATNMGIINAFIPIFSMLLSLMILQIKPTKLAIIGTLISIAGLIYLIAQGDLLQALQGSHLLGDVLMVVAVLLYAFYGVYLQRWQLKLPLPIMLYVQISFAVLFHIPLLMYLGLDQLTADNIKPVLYAALLPSIVAPFVWMLAIQYLGSNRTSMFINLAPIFTAIIAYIFLKEQWTSYHTVGGILVLCGILLAQKK